MEIEENAVVGVMPGVDLAKRKAKLQEMLDKTMIAFSINANPEFKNGNSRGNLLIENSPHNNKLIGTEIYLKNT